MADGDLTSIRISATADTSSATSALKELATALERISAQAKALVFPNEKIKGFTESMKSLTQVDTAKLSKAVDGLASSLRKINEVNIDPSKAKALAEQMKAFAAVGEARAKMEMARHRGDAVKAQLQGAENARKREERLAQQEKEPKPEPREPRTVDVPKFGLTAASAQKLSSYLQRAMANANGLKTALVSLVNLGAKALSGIATGAKNAAIGLAKMVANMALAPWKRLGTQIGSIVSRLKGFFAAIKRIAIYRAIRAMLKALTQAFKEGVTNLYQYSKAMEGTFAKSMDSLATSSLYLKNSLGAMAAPIINALAPAIDFLVDKIVGLLNKFNELVAAMTGASTWTAALKYPKEWAESTDDAAGKAKELRKTLLGFDEINRLDDNNKGSRGKAAETLDYSKMFEERTVETKAKNFIKKIKEAFKKGDFTDIGKNIGESLKNGLDNIPWDKIKDRLNKNASSVATLINGFISVPGLGESIGRTIAEAFNTAVGKMNTFFSTVHWDDLGKFLGDGINGILKNFNVEDLARGLAGIVNSGFELINNFINTVDWEELGTFLSNGINGFFDELNTEQIGKTISNGVRNAIKLVHTFFTKTDFEEIGNKIGKLIKEIDWGAVLKGLAQLLWDAVKAAAEAVKGIAEESPAFALAIAGLVAYKIATALGAATITQTITGALSKAILGASTASAVGTTAGGAASVSGAAVAGKAALVGAAAYGGYKLGEAIGELEPVKKATDSMMEGVFGEIKTEIDPDKYKDEQYDKDLAQWRRQQAEKQIKKDEELRKEIKKTYGGTPGSFYGYASGGTPRTGSLFLAGEAGAEIISSQSGHTSVSNRDQIAESVAQGNEESNALLREQNDLLRRLLAKDTTVAAYISTDSIVSGLDRKNRRDGRTSVPVGV